MSRVLPSRTSGASPEFAADASLLGPYPTDLSPDVASSEDESDFVHASGSLTADTAGVSSADVSVANAPVDLREIPYVRTPWLYSVCKRATDILGAMVGLTLFSPVMLVCAVLIKWQDGGPVFYRQARVGERGRTFSILKFRSMVTNADAIKDLLADQNTHSDNRTFKILNDPRITPVGRFMRRLSFDELPQFWNILVGQMSLVGPRPSLPSEVELYERRDLIRLAVRPGLTCIWQVSGRSNLDFTKQRQLDADYIRRRSFWLDALLILKTFPAVFRGDGAA